MRRLAQDRMHEVALAARGLGPVAGVDEAGRGACAGPLVAAACILDPPIAPELAGLTDSKRLGPAARARLEPAIKSVARAWAVVAVEPAEIDARGITHANLSAMRRAVAALDPAPGYVLVDAWRVPGLAAPQLPIIGGDAAARCIAAASVLAKVARDRIMVDHDTRWPGYGFAAHKGYGTRAHLAALARLGPAGCHRMSYANVRAACAADTDDEGAR
ncbi:ribonuclease HII [Corynebacterium sphenisci]|uniref:ribonuclease HII n=1 Tax=Corynebacterium sphenisci TaxID=191493 RepID=UPI0026DFCFE4|nr:ribonuclease HII [Corynebacterium sphenisci]MDO5731824.1 ribonuclease HII [Corynebacterium sphenisci]